ncbi:uncharacterized protein HD556DRAFT_1309382 [Suillus plorans]|uniref:Uncharacterized protein n=1 Tax=Suillus plorans TaxID=116603 RepID=A0A9P7AMA6_9AGAM|nr:uncharacterized protein HD556DRAFT_1309382 [Suillus plorans]KAG1792310.1 hypothetical protein HD556DRAFT_1309382 [Suillus plorans]
MNELGTYFGAVLGLRPSTMQGCPPVAQRLQVLAPSGKSHFICNVNRRPVQTDRTNMCGSFNRSQGYGHFGRLNSDNQSDQDGPAIRRINVRGPVTAPERRSGGPKGGPKVRARVFVEADETPMHVRSRIAKINSWYIGEREFDQRAKPLRQVKSAATEGWNGKMKDLSTQNIAIRTKGRNTDEKGNKVARRQRKLRDKERQHRNQNHNIRMERSEKAMFRPAYKIMRAIKVIHTSSNTVKQSPDRNMESNPMLIELVDIEASN